MIFHWWAPETWKNGEKENLKIFILKDTFLRVLLVLWGEFVTKGCFREIYSLNKLKKSSYLIKDLPTSRPSQTQQNYCTSTNWQKIVPIRGIKNYNLIFISFAVKVMKIPNPNVKPCQKYLTCMPWKNTPIF